MNKRILLAAAACLCLGWLGPLYADNHEEADSEGVGVLIKIVARDGHDEAQETNVMPHVADMHRAMVVDMNEVSHWPEDGSGYTHVQVESWYVRNGHYGSFNTGLKRVAAALKAGGEDNTMNQFS